MKNFFANNFQFHSNVQELGIVVFQNYQGFEGPDIRLSSYVKPGQHGAVVTNQLKGGRTLQIPGRIAHNDIPTYKLLRRSLQNAFRIIKDVNARSQPVVLKFQTLDDLYLQAEVYATANPQFTNTSIRRCTYLLQLFAPDPNFYAQSVSTYPLTLPSFTGLVYPVIYPVTYPAGAGGNQTVTNTGDANTPMQITFNGPLTSPFLQNLTTGEVFAINLTLNAGDTLVVDTAKHTMVLNNASNALQYYVLSNTWMELVPGDNLLSLGSSISGDSGNAVVSFRSAYEGV